MWEMHSRTIPLKTRCLLPDIHHFMVEGHPWGCLIPGQHRRPCAWAAWAPKAQKKAQSEDSSTGAPDVGVMQRIAHALQVSPEWGRESEVGHQLCLYQLVYPVIYNKSVKEQTSGTSCLWRGDRRRMRMRKWTKVGTDRELRWGCDIGSSGLRTLGDGRKLLSWFGCFHPSELWGLCQHSARVVLCFLHSPLTIRLLGSLVLFHRRFSMYVWVWGQVHEACTWGKWLIFPHCGWHGAQFQSWLAFIAHLFLSPSS